MRLSACITTLNRTQELDACLRALWNSQVKPYSVIVSDNSPEYEVQQKNREVVSRYPGTTYLIGPRTGASTNRQNAVSAVTEAELVCFVDDDIYVDPDFITSAIDLYTQIPPEERNRTILTGVSRDEYNRETSPIKLSFRGYFRPTDKPQAVVLHAAVFPRKLFNEEQWDPNIFIGQEDAELCLRALKQGYHILHCPELSAFNAGSSGGTLTKDRVGRLTDYEIYAEASRLYIGIKRYTYLSPNPFKLIAFIAVYFIHMTAYLLKRRSLQAWPKIISRSKIQNLWKSSHIQVKEANLTL